MKGERPNPSETLAGLKDFQRDTVEHVFRRLWTDEDSVKRFLVADEVGLGKTMVAKGVIAKTIDYLWDDVDRRIDVVYICSNVQIARQNLRRLGVDGGEKLNHADRLTMLPTAIRQLAGQKVNFVSFTPGTSFDIGRSGGKSAERVLLYWLIAKAWGRSAVQAKRWLRFFRGSMSEANFKARLSAFDRRSIDDTTSREFARLLDTEPGPSGGRLRDELEECVGRFNYLRREPDQSLKRERYRLIGCLRQLVAKASVEALEPDLVILDEFQRFKDLLEPGTPGSDLAHALFDHPDAKVLLLSATPYKMYTLPDEPEGDDHYRDFFRTVDFLAGPARSTAIESSLHTMREALVSGGDLDTARSAKDDVERELRRVMCRTERLATTPDRDGMLAATPLPGVRLTADEVRTFQTVSSVARLVDRQDTFEYWRSSPYLFNLMENYQIKARLRDAVGRPDIAAALRRASGLLSWDDLRNYRALDPGNAKMRGLVSDVLDRGAWRLAWLPPSLPYYDLGGAYAEPGLRSFTKRLVFSAWAVVPKAIGVVVSYEAERRARRAAGTGESRAYEDVKSTTPLQFKIEGDAYRGMPVLALLYPSVAFAAMGDPLALARAVGKKLPADRSAVMAKARRRLGDALSRLPNSHAGRPDERWYWAAPFLLDRHDDGDRESAFAESMRRWAGEDDDQTGLAAHVRRAMDIEADDLGPHPDDLVDVLSRLAVAGPGNCALRALSRVCGGPGSLADKMLRSHALTISSGLRSLFNRSEVMALVRGSDEHEGTYWMRVLDHSVDGCLQSVLDEYVHVLVESEGLQDKGAAERATAIASNIDEALTLKTVNNTVDEFVTSSGAVRVETHRARLHFAARFGRGHTDDKTVVRESQVRTAYNSPFWPFVLASTSVGQEGLDFHTYSHAVVHWNLPGNPVDIEQREGRVHRYKGHAVRKNIAAHYGHAAFHASVDDPWYAMFLAAAEDRPAEHSELFPYWVYAPEGGAKIERYVPTLPLSQEELKHRRLLRTVGAYRLVVGQPRQEDLLHYLGDRVGDLSWLRIDLTPPEVSHE